MSSNMMLTNTILAGDLLQENAAAGGSREETDKLRVATPAAGVQPPVAEQADDVIIYDGKYVATARRAGDVFGISDTEMERLAGYSLLHPSCSNPFPSPIRHNGKIWYSIYEVLRWWLRRNDETIIRVINALLNAAPQQAKASEDDASTDPVLKKAREVLTPSPTGSRQIFEAYRTILFEMFDTGLTESNEALVDFIRWMNGVVLGYHENLADQEECEECRCEDECEDEA